jgi:predicted secreted hydrolase
MITTLIRRMLLPMLPKPRTGEHASDALSANPHSALRIPHWPRLYWTLPFTLLLAVLPAAPAATTPDGWQLALPGWQYQFPRDHGVHPPFKTEWWYFTGSLHTADGREFGYEITWFREGILPVRPAAASRFVVQDFKFAHFALSDIAAAKFHFAQKVSRGAYGDAGNGNGQPGPLAWIDDWRLTVEPSGAWRIAAAHEGISLALQLTPQKPPVIEGEQGISVKSAGEGHASCYYSYTRMAATGLLTLPGAAPQAVTGETWFDHEWATNQLAPDQAGWDWFSLQLSDGTELMLYRMRLKNGHPDPASSGTFIPARGQPVYLKASDFILTPLDSWHSPATQAAYPIRWRVQIPRLKMDVQVSTPLDNQELALPGIVYWEGLIHASGTSGGAPVTGHGYLELTGYAATLTGLSQ